MLDLHSKVAIVTGSGTGLGKATAVTLAQFGASVTIAGIDIDPVQQTAREIEQSGAKALAVQVDVSDRQQVEMLMRRTADHFGGIDILVNNAAIYPSRSWTEIDEPEWDRVFAVNMKAFYLCARTVYPYMKQRGRGKIINLSSITAFLGFPKILHYVSTKGAIIAFTRSLARESGVDEINVNCVAPGAFPTAGESIQGDAETFNRRVLEAQSIKRRGKPQDVANAILFFASEMSDFITGQTLVVDGGWVMH